MKPWQRNWLIFILFFSSLHLIRDVLQIMSVQNAFTTTFRQIKSTPIWLEVTALLDQATNIVISLLALKQNKFHPLGWITFGLFFVFVIIFVYYTFLL